MMIAFQIFLFLVIFLFAMGSISEQNKEARMHYTSVTIAGILSMCFTLWLGGSS